MADPFANRRDLTLGDSTPYTDDADGYDPTYASTVYSLPQLDPAVNNNNAPPNQSAAPLEYIRVATRWHPRTRGSARK